MESLKFRVKTTVSASQGYEFEIIDIFKQGSDLCVDLTSINQPDNFANDLPVISLSDLEQLTSGDRLGFIDTVDYKGDHTTEDNYMTLNSWLDEIEKVDLINYVEKHIITAIDEAIKNKVL